MNQARLLVLESNQEVTLDQDTTVGRDPSGVIVLSDPSVSGQHARIYWSDGDWRIQDLGSRNGTEVNGESVQDATLSDGAKIGIGTVRFVFRVRRNRSRAIAAAKWCLATKKRALGTAAVLMAVLLGGGAALRSKRDAGNGPSAPTVPIQVRVSEYHQQLLQGTPMAGATLDRNLFLALKNQEMFRALSGLGASPTLEQQLNALSREAALIQSYARSANLDPEIAALFAHYLDAHGAVVRLLEAIGAIDREAARRLDNSRSGLAVESGKTAFEVSYGAAYEGADFGDSVAQGLIAGGIEYLIKDWMASNEVDKQKEELRRSAVAAFERATGQIRTAQQAALRSIAARNQWTAAEIGFNESDSEAAQLQAAAQRGDLASMERISRDAVVSRPRDPFAWINYADAVLRNAAPHSPDDWMIVAETSHRHISGVPDDPLFAETRLLLHIAASRCMDAAAEAFAQGNFMGTANDVTRLAALYAQNLHQAWPRDPVGVARLMKAKASAHAGAFAEASGAIREVLPYFANQPVPLIIAARIFARAGQPDLALDALQRGLAAGWSNTRYLRASYDLHALRASPQGFSELLRVKHRFTPKWGAFTDDVSLTNASAFPLTNVTLRVDATKNGKTDCHMLERLAVLQPGETKTWTNIMSIGGGAQRVWETLTCDQQE